MTPSSMTGPATKATRQTVRKAVPPPSIRGGGGRREADGG
jgi:hypothetical protein